MDYNIFYDYREQYGLAIVEKDGKFGVIQADSTIKIPIEYDYIFGFKNAVSLLIKAGKYGAMDTTGTIIVPVEYDDVNKFPKDILDKLK